MHKLTERLEKGADEKIEFKYGPHLKKPYDKDDILVNKISFLMKRQVKVKDVLKNPFPDLIDTIELADNYLVYGKGLKRLKYKGFAKGQNHIIVKNIYYDRFDLRLDIVVEYLDRDDTMLLNGAIERASKDRKSLEAKKDMYLLYLFDE